MNVTLTESRELIRLANELPVTDLSVIRELAFPVLNDKAVMADKIDIVVVEPYGDIATLQAKNGKSKVVAKKGKTLITVEPPHVRESMIASADYLLTFDPSKVWGKTAEELNAMREDALAEMIATLKQRLENRIAVMGAQLLQTGAISYTDADGFSFSFDMNWDSPLLPNLTGTARWNQSGADIDANLRTWAGTIRQKAPGPDTMIMGEAAFSAFISNDKVKGNFDRQNWRVGALTPSLQVAYQGTYNGLDIFVASGTYTDVDGVDKSVYHTDKVTLFNRQFAAKNNAVLYGLIREVAVTIGEKIHMKQWVEEDPSGIWNLLDSAPVPTIPVVGSVVTARVLNAA